MSAVIHDTDVQKSERLYNKELSPESSTGNWRTWNIFAWWMSAWHSLGGYTMAVGLFALGLTGWQMIVGLSAGMVALLFLSNLSGVAGQRAQVPFPVFARASFGVFGANIPAILRAVVAIAWYGIQTYLASAALMLLVMKLVPGTTVLMDASFLGLSALGWICFLGLSVIQLLFLLGGMETVRKLTDFAGPAIWIAMIALAIWVLNRANWQVDFNFSTVPSSPGAQLLGVVAGMFLTVAYFAGPILNFADFTRNAPTASSVRRGNAWGLLLNGIAFAAISVIIALASVQVYGEAIHDPVALLEDLDNVALLLIAIISIGLATAGINIILNYVAPVYDLINVWPRVFNFKTGGILVAFLAVAITPWNLYSNPVVVNQFIGSVGALMGPLFGVIYSHYLFIEKKTIDRDALFSESPSGKYFYSAGYNKRAIAAVAIAGVVTILIANLPVFAVLASFSWPIGTLLAVGIYLALMKSAPQVKVGADQ